MKREHTRIVKIGNLTLGGDNNILIQSMCKNKTSKKKSVVKEINNCALLGAQIMRISILDNKDLKAIKYIKEHTTIPLVADIHYSLKYAIEAIKEGIDAVRINPGNTKDNKELDELLFLANKKNVAIRIGINRGSIEIDKDKDIPTQMVDKVLEYIKYFESKNFFNTVISVKDSDPLISLSTYRLLAEKCNYPLHIGITESGIKEIGIIRSCAILSILLSEGIGSTIRISLTSSRKEEILTCKRLLHDLNLYKEYPTLVSCPTCGRCMVKDTETLARKTLKFLEDNNINLKVAIMGCVVNGIKEGENADIGIAGGKSSYILFKKGKKIKVIDENNVFEELKKEILDIAKISN